MTDDISYECPRCHDVLAQPAGLEVWHPCPKTTRKPPFGLIRMHPQPVDNAVDKAH